MIPATCASTFQTHFDTPGRGFEDRITTAHTTDTATSTPIEPADIAVDACPELADVLHSLEAIDRTMARVVQVLVSLQRSGAAEAATGVALELWLEQHGRMTRSDRRMAQTAANVLADMPATLAAFAARRLSWSQVRVIVLEVRQLPVAWRPRIDDALIGDLDLWELASPDDLGIRLRHAIASLLPDRQERDEQAATRGRFLSVQPSLTDEYHGRIFGEGPNTALAAIADALDALVPPPPGSARPGVGADVDPSHEAITTQGRRRFDALVLLCLGASTDADLTSLPDIVDGPVDLFRASNTPVHLTVTCDLETLLGMADRPGHLVTTLTGGRLRTTAATIRRLADVGGSLRLLVTDDHGEVIGIGRRARVAPDWLADAVRTMFPASIGPGSRASSRHCDLDHHDEWHDGGDTDLDNLAPVDRRFHTTKSNGAWTIRAGADGTRVISHPGSGWRQTVIPATRRIRLDVTGNDPPR